jgi:phenylacetaldehyde dehydrogenase
MTTLCPETTQFLSAQPLKMFIGGRWTDSLSGAAFETRDPGTGSVIARVSAGDAADVERAVQAAGEAFRQSGWATLPANDRGVILHRLADLIDKHQKIIV